MSRAFDTIRRDKLLTVIETFVNDSELRLIRMLLAETTLQPILKHGMGSTFATTIGTPQGDSLSPVLFVIYLEAALRDLRNNLPHTNIYSWLAGAATYDTTNHPRQIYAGSGETAPQHARLATFKNNCIRQKPMA